MQSLVKQTHNKFFNHINSTLRYKNSLFVEKKDIQTHNTQFVVEIAMGGTLILSERGMQRHFI
jgi:hypothetical protein